VSTTLRHALRLPFPDPKAAYLRKKFTTTKKPHYIEGWVEFKDKRVARSVATMLNAQPVGGKKGTRWRDDVWTMKYLSRFKWFMLTEQVGTFPLSFLRYLRLGFNVCTVAHEQATREARLRVELSQSKTEQKHYLKQVEVGRSLEKRAEKKRKRAEEQGTKSEQAADSTPKVTEQKKDFKRKAKRGR
jgi:ESF2/ABP1 family protein